MLNAKTIDSDRYVRLHGHHFQHLLSHREVSFVFMERYLNRIGNILWRLAVSHAVPAGSREVTVAFTFISERTVFSKIYNL
jgi:hypothetical protein